MVPSAEQKRIRVSALTKKRKRSTPCRPLFQRAGALPFLPRRNVSHSGPRSAVSTSYASSSACACAAVHWGTRPACTIRQSPSRNASGQKPSQSSRLSQSVQTRCRPVSRRGPACGCRWRRPAGASHDCPAPCLGCRPARGLRVGTLGDRDRRPRRMRPLKVKMK